MAQKVDPKIGRKILEVVRREGGSVIVPNLQHFKELTAVNCSMNVFKREVAHLTGSGGKLSISKTEHAGPDSSEAKGLIIRLTKSSN